MPAPPDVQALFEDWYACATRLYWEAPSEWDSYGALLYFAKGRAQLLGLEWRHEEALQGQVYLES